jgi:hypothetical protein
MPAGDLSTENMAYARRFVEPLRDLRLGLELAGVPTVPGLGATFTAPRLSRWLGLIIWWIGGRWLG